jgi:putative transposase
VDNVTLFECLNPILNKITIGQLAVICQAILTMTGRITMLGISRWTEKGGSYRTIQRFFAQTVPWTQVLVKFFQTHLFAGDREYILAGDETVVTKAGKQTHGIERLFSGLYGKVVKGLGFFVFSVVDVLERKAYPLAVRQMVRSEAEKQAIKSRKKKRTKKKSKAKGRAKGSANKDKNELNLSPELLRISELLGFLLKLLRQFIKVKYLAMDGHFGHHQAVLMARENDLHLISKMRKDAALFEKYEGEYGGRGPKKKYGKRLKYDFLPVKYLKKSESEKEIITNYYQGRFLHKEFGSGLNAVIIVKLNKKTKKVGHAILFSSDVELGWEKLTEYYSLRFQIEFNFREAKQHFGLEDFMNTTETGVENAANVAFLMVNLSAKLIKNSGEKSVGVLDLKTHFRGVKYALETIKLVLKNPEVILIKQIKEEIGKLGSIHRTKIATSTA